MQQQIATITLGVTDLTRSKKFYTNGFGWEVGFENDQIVFYQMNGFILGTFLLSSLKKDLGISNLEGRGAITLAHNVLSKNEVQECIANLIDAGGSLLKKPSKPPHGGFRGYIADPDGHPWEIAFNPKWSISDAGYVSLSE